MFSSVLSVRNDDGFDELLEWSQLLLVNQAKLLQHKHQRALTAVNFPFSWPRM